MLSGAGTEPDSVTSTGAEFTTGGPDCAEAMPEFKEVESGHFVACHLYDQEKNDGKKLQTEE